MSTETKHTKTGVILDSNEVAYILAALKFDDASKEAYKRAMDVAISNGLEKFEMTDKKYYSMSDRFEIILVEVIDDNEIPS